jgi:hypothetical protein
MNDHTYREILEQLLEDSIKDLPDKHVLKSGLSVIDEDGFKYTIIKVGKKRDCDDKLFKIKCNNEIKIVDEKEIKKYKRV